MTGYAWIFMIVVWAIISGSAGLALNKIVSQKK